MSAEKSTGAQVAFGNTDGNGDSMYEEPSGKASSVSAFDDVFRPQALFVDEHDPPGV